MNYIEFGNKCFNVPASEQSIDIVIGSKTEANSLEDFIEKAVNYLCTEIYMERSEIVFPKIINRSADKGSELIAEFLSGMDQSVELHLEEITSIVYVTEPRWNNYDLAFETNNSYVFFTWSTTA
ncbi:MAG: hypothetical protein K2N56_06065 [Oscillospiraceae bacterium]|nr:hypothetical protein [Oscillospiraceae bacterium]